MQKLNKLCPETKHWAERIRCNVIQKFLCEQLATKLLFLIWNQWRLDCFHFLKVVCCKQQEMLESFATNVFSASAKCLQIEMTNEKLCNYCFKTLTKVDFGESHFPVHACIEWSCCSCAFQSSTAVYVPTLQAEEWVRVTTPFEIASAGVSLLAIFVNLCVLVVICIGPRAFRLNAPHMKNFSKTRPCIRSFSVLKHRDWYNLRWRCAIPLSTPLTGNRQQKKRLPNITCLVTDSLNWLQNKTLLFFFQQPKEKVVYY